MTEGPYYVRDVKVRRTITEGVPGAPLALRLTVVDATTCKPIKGAAVDIWRASAAGLYSGEQANNTVGRTCSRTEPLCESSPRSRSASAGRSRLRVAVVPHCT